MSISPSTNEQIAEKVCYSRHTKPFVAAEHDRTLKHYLDAVYRQYEKFIAS